MPTNINGNTGIDKVQDGTVVNADIDTLDASKLTGSIAAARIANNTIDSAHIASGAVDDAHLATGITASKLTGALPAISAASLTNVPKDTTVGGRKNIIINGAMQVSQRGDYTSATAISDGTYYLDRWELDVATVTGTVQNVSNGYLSKLNTQKIAATSTATGRLVSIQKIEVSGGMLGEELTASAQVKSNSTDARLFLVDNTNGTVLDVVAHTGGGAFEKLSVSGTAPTSCTDLRVYLALRSSAQGNVAITSGDYFEFTNVQLELSSTATDFEYRSYGEELALCQRYYEVLGSTDVIDYGFMYIGGNWTTTNSRFGLQWSVTKRTSPTITESGTWYVRNSSGNSIGVTAKTFDQPSPYGAAPYVNCAGGLTVGHTAQIWGDDGLIKVDAEL